MELKPTTQFRIKREYDYVGYEERQVNIDTLQQLWAVVAPVNYNPKEKIGPPVSEWRDVPIVEADKLYDECPEKKG